MDPREYQRIAMVFTWLAMAYMALIVAHIAAQTFK